MRISDWSSDVCSSDLREGARESRRGAAGKGQCRRIRAGEVRLLAAVRPAAIAEAQGMAMLAVADRRRIVDRDVLQVAVEVGQRDEQDRKSTRLNSSH